MFLLPSISDLSPSDVLNLKTNLFKEGENNTNMGAKYIGNEIYVNITLPPEPIIRVRAKKSKHHFNI